MTRKKNSSFESTELRKVTADRNFFSPLKSLIMEIEISSQWGMEEGWQINEPIIKRYVRSLIAKFEHLWKFTLSLSCKQWRQKKVYRF